MASFGFVGALEYELVGERSASLGRAGLRLTEALDTLAAAGPGAPGREQLVASAGVRLWELIVQRESCGFTQHGSVYEAWDIPPEVWMKMGPG